MVDAICAELSQRSPEWADETIQTLYFGGGTPSVLSAGELEQVMNVVRKHYALSAEAEITFETNPDDFTEEQLHIWKEVGINRLSIGLQSFRAQDLAWMNRSHTAAQSRSAVAMAQQAGFSNITVDLIYGLPDLSMEEWKSHIKEVIGMNVPHVSAYCLTVEQKTALNHLVRTGELKVAEEEEQSEQFLLLSDELEQAGYSGYEISNFARPGFESKHNSSYWNRFPYLGIGPSAHSFRGRKRRWNVANNRKYMKALEEGTSYWESEELSETDVFNEQVLTGLRTSRGLRLSALNPKFIQRREFVDVLHTFERRGWLNIANDSIILTREGKLRADHIAATFFAESED